MKVYDHEHVGSHPLTKHATKVTGLSVDDLLADVRVVLGEAEFPEQWVVTWSSPQIEPSAIADVRAFAILAWLFSPESEGERFDAHRDHAHQMILKEEYALGWNKAEKFRPGRRERALSPLAAWIEDYLRRNPSASNDDILRRLRYDEPEAERVDTNDPDQTGIAFRGKRIPKKRLRERARECRERLGITP